ncbi:MAG: hypothetical protein ABIP89_09005 [Polyangiaceae bacterium]
MAFFGAKKEEEKARPTDVTPPPAPSIVPKPSVVPTAKAPPPPVAYGIEKAIQLMRSLPQTQNVELVVMVIKTTLESLKVNVADIIEDAIVKERELESRVAILKDEIGVLQKQVELRVDEIVRLEAAHAETTSVKERLQLAEKTSSSIT